LIESKKKNLSKLKLQILLFYHLITVTNMVQTKTKTTVTRARIAHKLAKYVRATSIHLTGVRGQSNPSTSHLSITFVIQLLEEPLKEDSEIKLIPGIQLMTKRISLKELARRLKLLKAENLFKTDQLLFFFQVPVEVEELLSLNHLSPEIFWSLDHMPLMEYHSEE